MAAASALAMVGTSLVGWRVPPASAAVFSNTTPLTVDDAACPPTPTPGTADVYPSDITVSGVPGTVTDVNVSLLGVTSAFEGDLEVMLVGPGGGSQNLVLLSDAGTGSLTNATIVFDDAAGAQAPQSGSWGTGSGTVSTIRPTDYAVLNDNSWPAPAPAPSSTTTLATSFNGVVANGTWSLYVIDDGCDLDPLATIAGGWSLDVTAAAAAEPTTTAVSSSLNPSRTGQSVTFTATVTSSGSPVTSGTVTFSEGGTTLAGPVAVNGSGQASFSTTGLAEGDHTVTATYDGTSSFATSSGLVDQRVDNDTVVTDSTYCNPGAVTIAPVGAAAPYPSNVFVTGAAGTLATATVQLKNISHPFGGDIDVLLAGPGGTESLVLMSDAGTAAVSNATVTFDDTAPGSLPATGSWGTGTFKPTNYASGAADSFPAPAPAASSATTLQGAFNDLSPNGTWSLYVADDSGGDGGAIAGGWCLTVVPKALPTITTTASGTVVLGGQISDTATVSGGSSPTGTVTFSLFGPDDATCAGAPVFTSANRPLSAGTAASEGFTPSAPGTYRWVASYSGDLNNSPVAGACNDANESVVVTQATPAITTQASGTVAVSGQISDTATVTGGASPTGTVTFTLFGPDNATCAGAPVFTSDNRPLTGGTATSAAFTTTAPGTYRWVAAYSGDANNNPVTGACNDANESVVVTQATPTLTTSASGPVMVGSDISDIATVSGGSSPTGTVTFSLFGPGNATCTGAPVFTSTQPLSGLTATSDPFTTTAAGTYRWVASYSGDANNASVTSACNDADETSTVTKAEPTLTTDAVGPVVVGGQVADTATLAGGFNPTGTIVFTLFGPNDATCSGAPAFSSTVTVTGNGSYTSGPFAPIAAGTYRWLATYSGDANNNSVSGACNDANESNELPKARPGITTTATTTATVGTPVLDTAALPAGFNPTGTITFTLFGPNDATCAGPPVFSSTATVAGNGPYPSEPFTPTTAGTYRWVAAYSGDANNAAATSACNAANETTTVTRVTPTVTMSATPTSVAAGASLSAAAILAGGFSPSGSLTFRLFGPSDATCAGTPVGTSVRAVKGNTVYASDALAPPGPGTYRWTASYSGDTNNVAVNTACAATQVVASPPAGYWLAGDDGGVFAFGSAGYFGSVGALRLNRPIVAMAPTSTGRGYWLATADGGVFALGDAGFFGSLSGLRLNQPIVAIAPTPSGRGYWLVGADGGVFALGDAVFRGSVAGVRLSQPIVGIEATPTGRGYWLVGADGGVFALGDATYLGGLGGARLNQRIAGMAATPTGRGYWLVGADGGVFGFGDAAFAGSLAANPPGQPIVGITASSTGRGYWLAGARGGVYAFGDAAFAGSAAGLPLRGQIAAIAARL